MKKIFKIFSILFLISVMNVEAKVGFDIENYYKFIPQLDRQVVYDMLTSDNKGEIREQFMDELEENCVRIADEENLTELEFAQKYDYLFIQGTINDMVHNIANDCKGSDHIQCITINEKLNTENKVVNFSRDLYERRSESGDMMDANEGIIGSSHFCLDTSAMWQFAGYFVMIIKIVIPVIIIILGMIDLSKASVSGDDAAVGKATKAIINRLIAGIAIFFLPTLINFIFSAVSSSMDILKNTKECRICLLKPTSDECNHFKEVAKANRTNRD